MISHCIQNLMNKYKISRFPHSARYSRLISKLGQLSQPFLCTSHLCAEVRKYKVCRWKAEIPLYVFFRNRVEAYIKCAVDACEHYRSIEEEYNITHKQQYDSFEILVSDMCDKSNLLAELKQWCCLPYSNSLQHICTFLQLLVEFQQEPCVLSEE